MSATATLFYFDDVTVLLPPLTSNIFIRIKVFKKKVVWRTDSADFVARLMGLMHLKNFLFIFWTQLIRF